MIHSCKKCGARVDLLETYSRYPVLLEQFEQAHTHLRADPKPKPKARRDRGMSKAERLRIVHGCRNVAEQNGLTIRYVGWHDWDGKPRHCWTLNGSAPVPPEELGRLLGAALSAQSERK